MAHSRGSRFRSRSNGSRRAVTWQEGPFGQIAVTATEAVVFPTGQAAQVDDLTLVRTRGELLAYLTVAGGAANEGFRCYFGICIVSENAAGVGISAIPTPLSDIAWDGWLVHHTFNVREVGTALADSLTQQVRIPIDSKAMRKMHQTDTIVAVLQTTEIGDGATMVCDFVSRMLLKLP